MALTINGAGSASSTTSSATLSTSAFIQTWSNPDLIVVCVAADNNGTNGAASISSVSDSKGHTYTQRQIQNQDPGAAAAGATVAIYTAVATTGLTNGDTITVNFSPNTAAKAMYVWRVSAASTEFVKYVTAGGAVGATANPTVTTVSITSGNAMIGALASESNVTPTADTDTTGGSWAGHTNATANTGTAATSMNVHTGYKITTATGTQTWNQTLVANDWANAYIVLNPAARVNRTATGSGLGSDSDAQLVIRPRTATGSGAGTQSATGNRFAVVDRTASGSGVGTSGTVTLHNNIRSATGFGGASTGDAAVPLVVRPRTATGSGVGSQTATGNIIAGTPTHQRTATGSGVGSESSIRLRIVSRSGSASGVGGFDSTGIIIHAKTATGSGIGAGSASSLRLVLRSASSSGIGFAVVSSGKVSVRTASGLGEGSSSVRGEKVVVLLLKPRENVVVSRLYPKPRRQTAAQPLFPPRGRWN